jgi:hypothetical protein
MKTLFRKLGELLFSKSDHPYEITDAAEVPFHIKEIGRMYPILHTVAGNQAVGEIRLFVFNHKENSLRVGQALIKREKKGLTSTWIHLGNDYFKLVMKA